MSWHSTISLSGLFNNARVIARSVSDEAIPYGSRLLRFARNDKHAVVKRPLSLSGLFLDTLWACRFDIPQVIATVATKQLEHLAARNKAFARTN